MAYQEIQNQINDLTNKIVTAQSNIETFKTQAVAEYIRMADWLGAYRSTLPNNGNAPSLKVAEASVTTGSIESLFISSANTVNFSNIISGFSNDCGNNRPNCDNAYSTLQGSKTIFIGLINSIIQKKQTIKSYEAQVAAWQSALEKDPDYKLASEKQLADIEASEKNRRNTLIFIGVVIVVIVIGVIVAKKLKLF